MTIGRSQLAASLIAGLLLSAPAGFPQPANKLSGSIAGFVRDSMGVPQMGATVLLFNRSERLIHQALTNERGVFGFDSLTPDLYSVRVSLSSFMPAIKQKIAVQPGMQSLLYVDLASVLSSIELVYAAPGQGALMSDDWKWTLKGSAATRSVLRLLPDFSASDPNKRDAVSGAIFSDTRGLLNVSAGDPGSLGGTSAQADLGTAFALATSVFGRNQLALSGNVGYGGRGGMPAAGFRTSYRRDGLGPEVAVTVQQVYLPARASLAPLASQDGAPALRAMSLSVHDSLELADNMRLDYGASLDSVLFLDHLNSLSRFARLTYGLGSAGALQFAYSAGAPPVDLIVESHGNEQHVAGDTTALSEDLAALSLLPRLSLLNGAMAIQRTQDLEIGYEKKIRATTINLTAYRETVSNAAMTIFAPGDAFAIGDVMPDISSKSSILDAGSYQRSGFATSVTQAFGDKVEIGASFGRSGALGIQDRGIPFSDADDLRARIHPTPRFWASARASARLPFTGTQISGSYQWMDYNDVIMPNHIYLTQSAYPEAGLNLRVRQPIPALPGMPGRLEATAELRNGLAQGYLPVSQGGQHVLLIETPRAVRGGLSFIF